ncbi:hypothetical protein ACH5RR_036970 [Cinchona calisaya]|uniref:Uncharacterized protein n=1 Tax=Cinchona calisaya TaxID=153742 RepID=A0ABD2Y4R9_9GENT
MKKLRLNSYIKHMMRQKNSKADIKALHSGRPFPAGLYSSYLWFLFSGSSLHGIKIPSCYVLAAPHMRLLSLPPSKCPYSLPSKVGWPSSPRSVGWSPSLWGAG